MHRSLDHKRGVLELLSGEKVRQNVRLVIGADQLSSIVSCLHSALPLLKHASVKALSLACFSIIYGS